MRFVGLTGGLGAGKSEALAAFADCGAATLSTDAVVHELLSTDELRDLLVERWGSGILDDSGNLDRAKVAAVVFERSDELEWLEGTLFPRVGERVLAWRKELEGAADSTLLAVVEVPLLFEADMESAFDATVAVVAGEAARAARAAARGHELVDARAARQHSQEEKASRADYVIENSGTLQDLKAQVADLAAGLAAPIGDDGSVERGGWTAP